MHGKDKTNMFVRMRSAARRSRESSFESPCTPVTSPPTSPRMAPAEGAPMQVDPCGNSTIVEENYLQNLNPKLEPHASNTVHSHITSSGDVNPDNGEFIRLLTGSTRRRNLSKGNQNKLCFSLLDPKTKFDQEDCQVSAIAYNNEGDIMVSDAGNCKVKTFNSLGQLKVEYTIPSNYGNLITPAGLCTVPSGEIVVADIDAGNLKVFTPDGHFLTKFGKDLRRPCDVTSNSHGHVIVVEEVTTKIHIYKRFGNEGAVVLSGEVQGHTMQGGPRCLCVSDTGNIVVADEASKALIVYDCFGKYLSLYKGEDDVTTSGGARRPKSLCSSYSLGRLQVPHGVSNDHHGNVYVIDSGACRVSRFDLTKNAFMEEVISRDQGLVKPCRLAANCRGQIAVTEEGSSSIKIFDLVTE